jgi:hypothetical protein
VTAAKPKPAAKASKAAPMAEITMRKALSDPKLLGGSILGGESWAAWRVMLTAIVGEALTPDERALFKMLTGREYEPGEPVEEFWGAIGRRGGKSRAMGVLTVYLACFKNYDSVTVPGEKPTVLLLAQNVKQANVSLSYVAGILENAPMLAGMVQSRTADAIELNNGVTIEVRPASFRGLRGVTCVAVVADEIAFWFSEDSKRESRH